MADDNTQADEQPVAPEAEADVAAVTEEPAKPARRSRAKKAAEPVAEETAPEAEAADEAPAADPEPPADEVPAADEAAVAEEETAPAVEEPAPAAAEAPAAEDAEAKPAPAARAKKTAEPAAEAPKPKRTPRQKPLKKAARPKERKPHVREPRPVPVEGRRKERRGIVVSAAMDKTITIRIDSAKPHPKYHKIVRRSTRLHVHDERNEAGVGDVVRIVETRPLSKLKRWRMVEIVEKAK
jgi:small subunit ribosomal protein S17